MAKYYYYDLDKRYGPVDDKELIALYDGNLISADTQICIEGGDKWTPLQSVIDRIKSRQSIIKSVSLSPSPVVSTDKNDIPLSGQSCNETADILLSTCVIVFIFFALAQFIAGAALCSEASLEIGLPLMLSVPGYIFPIAIAYVLRQMFRHQLRG